MAPLSITACDAKADGQQWTVMADGRIALTASKPRKQIQWQTENQTAEC